MSEIIPNLFIVGSWKAGTTSLYRYLGEHPEVFMSQFKEPHYFVHHSRFRPRIFTRRSSYLGLFKKAGNAKVVGEASTYYFCMPESAGMIHAFNPDAKIVIMLRNPVDVIHAFHCESIFLGRETRSFSEALAYQGQHPEHVPNYVGLIQRWPEQIRHYQEVFGKDRVHIILFDDLVRQPAVMYKNLLRFLGIDASHQPVFSIHNPSKVPRSNLISRLSGSWLVVTAMRICCLSSRLAAWIEHMWRMQNRLQPRPKLDDQTRAKLVDLFTPTIEMLSVMLERDLSNWKAL